MEAAQTITRGRRRCARVAPLTNSHVSRKRRAYAVKSGFTPPEGNIYLLLICWMIARRSRRCQWLYRMILSTPFEINFNSADQPG
jgi:hypothetical protein